MSHSISPDVCRRKPGKSVDDGSEDGWMDGWDGMSRDGMDAWMDEPDQYFKAPNSKVHVQC